MRNGRDAVVLLTWLVSLGACGSRSGLFLFGESAQGGGGGIGEDSGAIAPSEDAGVPDTGSPAPPGPVEGPALVLFGGEDSSGDLGDTWVWSAGQWTRNDIPGPPARQGHTMASWRGTALLFGGYGTVVIGNSTYPPFLYDDTWQFDGTAWQQRATSGAPTGAEAAELNGMVVASVPGGGPGNNGRYTSVWDGASWTRKTVPGPPAYPEAAMATSGDRVIWAGAGQTWSWDGTAWTLLTQPSPIGNQYSHQQVYAASLASGVLLFIPPPQPATLEGVAFTGTAVWDGTAWWPRDVNGPTERTQAAMGAIPSEAILFGGGDFANGVPLGDTWSWDGNGWARLNVKGPSPRAGAAMAAFEESP